MNIRIIYLIRLVISFGLGVVLISSCKDTSEPSQTLPPASLSTLPSQSLPPALPSTSTYQDDPIYEKFTSENDIPKLVQANFESRILPDILPFTLEYPRSFKPELLPLLPDIGFANTYIQFNRDAPPEINDSDEAIQIDIQVPNYSNETRGVTLIYDIATDGSPHDPFTVEDVRLLDNRAIMISGIPSQYTVYSFRYGIGTTQAVIIRRASFSYAGYGWVLSSYAYIENADETEAYFDHLLKTFQFQK